MVFFHIQQVYSQTLINLGRRCPVILSARHKHDVLNEEHNYYMLIQSVNRLPPPYVVTIDQLPLLSLRFPGNPLNNKWIICLHITCKHILTVTFFSHLQPYLKSWSQELNAPILSVDYSLAPEAPFPRALEECFFAYCWAIKNHKILGKSISPCLMTLFLMIGAILKSFFGQISVMSMLFGDVSFSLSCLLFYIYIYSGWTGERVCLAGDSAGGNLCITVSMMAVAHRVRLPDGIMAAYPAFMLTTCASPSRLLSLMDPLLPLSVLFRCLSAYAGKQQRNISNEKYFIIKKNYTALCRFCVF